MTATVADSVSPARRRFSILSTPAAIADPYPVYADMRARPGLFWDGASFEWMASRYNDVRAILLDQDGFSSARRVDNIAGGLPPGVRDRVGDLEDDLRHWLLFMDDPGHGRLRTIVHSALTDTAVLEHAARHSAAIADELLARAVSAAGPDPFDFMTHFAHPFPLRVVSALLGVPEQDFGVIERWSEAIAGFLVILPRPADTAEKAAAGFAEVSAYLRELITARRARPAGDVLTALTAARNSSGAGLTDTEIVHTAAMLLFQGHETTKNLLGNGLLALLRHPDLLAALRADPARVGAAVDELARYDNPVQFVTRVAHRDTSVAGSPIRAGQLVLALIGSANRDPGVFPDPDTLKLGRPLSALTGHERAGGPRRAPLSFGIAHHLCVGQQIARLEIATALRQLLQRSSAIELATPLLEYRHILSIRSPRHLPIRMTPRRRSPR